MLEELVKLFNYTAVNYKEAREELKTILINKYMHEKTYEEAKKDYEVSEGRRIFLNSDASTMLFYSSMFSRMNRDIIDSFDNLYRFCYAVNKLLYPERFCSLKYEAAKDNVMPKVKEHKWDLFSDDRLFKNINLEVK